MLRLGFNPQTERNAMSRCCRNRNKLGNKESHKVSRHFDSCLILIPDVISLTGPRYRFTNYSISIEKFHLAA